MAPNGSKFRFLKRIVRRPVDGVFYIAALFVVLFLYWNMPAINEYNKAKLVNQDFPTRTPTPFGLKILAEHIKSTEWKAFRYYSTELVPENKDRVAEITGKSKTVTPVLGTSKLDRNDEITLDPAKTGNTTEMEIESVKLKSKNRGLNSSETKFDPENVFRDGSVLGLAQNDSRLLKFIRENHLFPPSNESYNLTRFPTGDPTGLYGATWRTVFMLLENKTKGFFIECGADDGELLSGTLVLERDFGWTGLLIEGDPPSVKKLLAKNRKAWIVDTFLSGEPYPQELRMQRHNERDTYTFVGTKTKKEYSPFTGKSLPIFSILSAINVFEVDFFMLDVELFELQILKTIPFDSVFIKVFVIEINGKLAPKRVPFVESKGYICLEHIENRFTHDYLFMHRSLYKEEMKNIRKGCFS